jgi:hypothetical protein
LSLNSGNPLLIIEPLILFLIPRPNRNHRSGFWEWFMSFALVILKLLLCLIFFLLFFLRQNLCPLNRSLFPIPDLSRTNSKNMYFNLGYNFSITDLENYVDFKNHPLPQNLTMAFINNEKCCFFLCNEDYFL